ncbi:SCO family protein [Pseudomonas syringae group genomosp. 3]|uniref:Sco1/SenC protein n=1 Tax=Pseudomonas syringae pv. primulae TaxID=251707 RepID=A0A3M3XVQ8_9PSED|nr:SCO family protein [Pseudomonas syringae group genomosp. 3]RMO73463.1 Sco1/SenC protein [Pseudomonas syringae pv. primulae]
MTRTQKTVFIVAAIVALVLGLVLSRLLPGSGPSNQTALNEAGIVLLPKSRQLPALSMIDQNGAAVALDGLKDQWTLMFFGYTFCPDICPTTLAQIKQIRSELPTAAVERMRVVLVSVDPNRDSPQQLKQYLSYFDPQYIGLTAPVTDIQKLANSVSIPFIPADTSKPNYFVDHSGNLALIGPDGTQRGFIRAPLNNQKLAKQLPGLLETD